MRIGDRGLLKIFIDARFPFGIAAFQFDGDAGAGVEGEIFGVLIDGDFGPILRRVHRQFDVVGGLAFL